jgi:hypothetical protein
MGIAQIDSNITACDSFVSPSGNNTWTTNGSYVDTVMNPNGCDSIFEIDLNVLSSTVGNDVVEACDVYLHPASGNQYTSSGTYTIPLTNAVGCDSILTLNLTIHTIDTSLTTTLTSISANMPSASYQWLNCDSNSLPIIGANGQQYTSSTGGNYAVAIAANGCTDTSACVNIAPLGMQASVQPGMKVYPNPNHGAFMVAFGKRLEQGYVSLYDVGGRVILGSAVQNAERLEMQLDLDAGLYYLRVADGEEHCFLPLRIQ